METSFPPPTLALTAVVPCHNEAGALPLTLPRLLEACRMATKEDFEIILVNDGSTDPTWTMIERLAAENKHIVGVNLSRRHGQQIALSAGLAYARGKRIFIIDADLQDPPELLLEMMRMMDDGANVVYGQRQKRPGEGRFKLWSSALFYRLMRAISDESLPEDVGDFRLMDRRVWEVLQRMPERQRYLRGMVAWAGFRQVPLLYDRAERINGRSNYPISRMLHFAMDGIASFSVAPLRLSLWLSLGCGSLALLMLFYVILSWVALGTVPGWTSLACIMLFFFGLQFFCIGMIGEYVGRIYLESKQRPLFVVDRIIGSERLRGAQSEPAENNHRDA